MNCLHKLSIASIAAALLGCSGNAAEAPPSEPDLDGFLEGKMDTGYVSNRAAELTLSASSRILIAYPGKTPEELMTIASEVRQRTPWNVQSQISEQLRFARNAMKAAHLDLNLEGGSPMITDVQIREAALELTYTISVESLIKYKNLAQGQRPEDFVGRVINAQLPLSTVNVLARATLACASDPDGDPVDPHEVRDYNFYYYFDPAKTGCMFGAADLAPVRFEVRSSANAATVYPEYDQLVADGEVSIAIMFAQIEHSPTLSPDDWGWIAYNGFLRDYRRRGFRVRETFANSVGVRMSKTYPNGLVVNLTAYTPVNFTDHTPDEQRNALFRTAIQNNEIVYFNGHSGYGSLRVLDQDVYPMDRYQIFFMDSCWSYSGYTKQIFARKATMTDPSGYAFADVVNNTEMANTDSWVNSARLLATIFKGADLVHGRGNARSYSWNAMIQEMNAYADNLADERDDPGATSSSAEIYGVSGVSTNRWNPSMVTRN